MLFSYCYDCPLFSIERIPGSWPTPWQSPRKIHFSSITRVFTIRFGHVKAFRKGLRAKVILTYTSIGICAYGLIPNQARIKKIQYKAWWYLDQKYLAVNGPTQDFQVRAPVSVAPWLSSWIECFQFRENKIIPVEQFGFAAGLSTSHQLFW
jgi:hypothetical protein